MITNFFMKSFFNSNSIPIDKKTNYSNGMFKFPYKSLNRQIRSNEEDYLASIILQRDDFQKNVINICQKLSEILKKSQYFISGHRYLYINAEMQGERKGVYPFPNIRFDSHEQLVLFFKTEKDTIKLLSIFWLVLFGSSPENIEKFPKNKPLADKIRKIDELYHSVINSTKDYATDKSKQINSFNNYEMNRFGNTKFVEFSNFGKNFSPHSKSVDYININKNSENPHVQQFIKENIPYISGYSGMANMACKTILLLNLKPNSHEAIMLMESISAFIVATGMHSYHEVYASFNLFLKEFMS